MTARLFMAVIDGIGRMRHKETKTYPVSYTVTWDHTCRADSCADCIAYHGAISVFHIG